MNGRLRTGYTNGIDLQPERDVLGLTTSEMAEACCRRERRERGLYAAKGRHRRGKRVAEDSWAENTEACESERMQANTAIEREREQEREPANGTRLRRVNPIDDVTRRCSCCAVAACASCWTLAPLSPLLSALRSALDLQTIPP